MARTLAENFRLLETAPLRLGILSTIGHTRLTRFLAWLEAAHPGIELAVSEGSMSDLRGGLDATARRRDPERPRRRGGGAAASAALRGALRGRDPAAASAG
jgi:DNA-binding transcriptional LysR family regulator